jgi:hypothetical protein
VCLKVNEIMKYLTERERERERGQSLEFKQSDIKAIEFSKNGMGWEKGAGDSWY